MCIHTYVHMHKVQCVYMYIYRYIYIYNHKVQCAFINIYIYIRCDKKKYWDWCLGSFFKFKIKN